MNNSRYGTVEDVLRKVVNVVEFSDKENISINDKGIFGNTPLAIVSGWGDLEGAELLVDAGAELDAKVEDGDTALHRAVAFGNLAVARLLIARGASILEKNNDGLTPVELARTIGDPEMNSLFSSD